MDFACPLEELAIEIDGGQHADRMKADDVRSAALGRHGYRVIRFWNNDVVENLETIRREIEATAETTSPGR